MLRTLRLALAAGCLASTTALGCGGGRSADEATPPACDAECRDGTALRALRETMKLAYNLALQGKPVGTQDATTPCPRGGTARIAGEATANAVQGATNVELTYRLEACGYLQKESTPEESYATTISGTLTEKGVLAVQPSATTALVIASDALSISGTVNDPPLAYDATSCPLEMTQDGNRISATLCGRIAGFSF